MVDVVIVGGGHNGLVAASYLARAGRRVVVLERRAMVGGACVTEEVFPGYWGNTGANLAAWSYPKILSDMELEKFGLELVRTNPTQFTPFPDGRRFVGWREKQRTVAELERFSKRDARAYYEFWDQLRDFARSLEVSLIEPPPELSQVMQKVKTPEHEALFNAIFYGSAKELLDEWFESEEIKATLGIAACVNNFAGPSTPGSAYMWLHRSLRALIPETGGAVDPQIKALPAMILFAPRGGMGALTDAMRKSVESAGAEVRTDAEVERILHDGDRATGVVLADGTEIHSELVVSNLDPKRTFLSLLPREALEADFRKTVEKLPMEGSVAKVILALDGLPRWSCTQDAAENEAFSRVGFRIAPSNDYMDRACEQARSGKSAKEPIIWGSIPSTLTEGSTPPGKHILCLTTFHFPYHLAHDDLNGERDAYIQRCIEVLTRYAPNLEALVLDAKCLTPRDIEARFGMTEGHNTHGDLLPSRAFASRPLPGCGAYRTPVRNLYLCGSGSFPGGGVSGLPGYNAAHQILRDWRAATT